MKTIKNPKFVHVWAKDSFHYALDTRGNMWVAVFQNDENFAHEVFNDDVVSDLTWKRIAKQKDYDWGK